MSAAQQTQAPTKTVEGTFGPKQITREEFVKRWASQVIEISFGLAQTSADYKALEAVKAQVEEMAGRKWDGLKS